MQLLENFPLKNYNTFGVDVKARYYTTFSNEDELEEIRSAYPHLRLFILGGGSNILFTDDFEGLVLKNECKGIEVVHEDKEYVYVKTGAGENWHHFVQHSLNRNWAGIENLSLIPGNAGAAPIQNIGAYGVELDDVFWGLEAFHVDDMKLCTFTSSDCEFGYRDSVFKKRFKDQFVILNITLCLRKTPIFHTSYGAITEELEKMGVKELSIQNISQAVINIRSSKLPDPVKIHNAGSFFKNPVVSRDEFQKLQARFPEIPHYPQPDDHVKLAAAWLIDQCGWKGYRKGDAGCHATQALVLVNYGNAGGKEIYDLSEEILNSVREKFGVTLEREVNIVPPAAVAAK